MKDQIEQNKEKLLDEIQRLAEKPITGATAEYMAKYREAYKAICLAEKERHGEKDRPRETGGDGLTGRQIKQWMEHLENEDGTTGPHYTMDQIEQYKRSMGIDCPIEELYAATNMMYSDYCRILKKYGMDRLEIYLELSKAFLDDKDAGTENKLEAYYECIVEGK